MDDEVDVVWSKVAEKQLLHFPAPDQLRIKKKVALLSNDRSYQLDIKKLTTPDHYFRLRVGDYRVIFTWRGDEEEEHCYVIAVKRRTSTTYLHEESAHYGKRSIY